MKMITWPFRIFRDHSFQNVSCLRIFWDSNISRYFFFACKSCVGCFLRTNPKLEPGLVKRNILRSIWTVCKTCMISLRRGIMKVRKPSAVVLFGRADRGVLKGKGGSQISDASVVIAWSIKARNVRSLIDIVDLLLSAFVLWKIDWPSMCSERCIFLSHGIKTLDGGCSALMKIYYSKLYFTIENFTTWKFSATGNFNLQ